MGCVIIRQAIRQAKRRYNLRPALCYALKLTIKLTGALLFTLNADSSASFSILAQAAWKGKAL